MYTSVTGVNPSHPAPVVNTLDHFTDITLIVIVLILVETERFEGIHRSHLYLQKSEVNPNNALSAAAHACPINDCFHTRRASDVGAKHIMNARRGSPSSIAGTSREGVLVTSAVKCNRSPYIVSTEYVTSS